ncbi:hypothetical protein [Deinococcus sp.]|uniref:hypothetical protein n=1 Tax=Deinococcus sp. TaxID=47478 RepID=UPI003C7BF74A
MSSPSNARPASNRFGPRIVLWVVIVLTLALLVWMSVFTARHNPYLSDVARNKISRSRFIETCKARVDAEVDRVSKSQNATFQTEYDPRALVSGAVSNPDPKVEGWVLISQVAVSRQGLGSQPVPFACQSDAQGAVVAQVGGGGSQPQQ